MSWREGNASNTVIIKCNNEKIYMHIPINNAIARLDEWKPSDSNLEIVTVSNNAVSVIVLSFYKKCMSKLYI